MCRARKDNLRDWAILELLAATGLRVSEVATLTHTDLTLSGKSGWVNVRLGKGKKTRRVPVHERAAEVLKEFQKTEADKGESAPLFSSRLKKPMTPYVIWGVVKKYAAEAGVEHVSPHSFRHTVATRFFRNPQVDLVTAATFLGHSPLDTTARYSQPNDDDLEKAAQKSTTRQSRRSHPKQFCAIENHNMPILSCLKSRAPNKPLIIETAILFFGKD